MGPEGGAKNQSLTKVANGDHLFFANNSVPGKAIFKRKIFWPTKGASIKLRIYVRTIAIVILFLMWLQF